MSDYIVFLILVLNTIFGVGILQRNSKQSVNRFYAAFVVALNIWIAANYLENEPSLVGLNNISFFLRLDFFFGIIFFYFWLRFVSAFAHSRLEEPRMQLLRSVLFVVSFLTACFAFYDGLLIVDAQFVTEVIEFTNGPLMLMYVGVLSTLFLSGVGIILFARHAAKKKNNLLFLRHIDYVILGSVFSLVVALSVNVIQIFYPIPLEISRVGLYGMSFIIIFTAYALVSARMFEMRLAILRSVSLLTFAFLIANLAIFLIILFTTKVFHIPVDSRTIVVAIFVATIISLSFNTLKNAFERLTDRFIFHGHYAPEAVMKRVTQTMVAIPGLHEMSEELLRIFKEEFRIEKAGLLLFDKMTNDTWIPSGFPVDLPASVRMTLRTKTESFYISSDELSPGPLKDILLQYDIVSLFLIKNKETPIALLLLGPKLSGELLHDEDVQFLGVLATEMAMGIQNAQTFSMIWQFNKQMEAKVRERTAELKRSQEQELEKAHEVLHLKDEFVFLAAHELRTPITAIRGFLELSEEHMDQVPEDIRENMTAIKETSTHLNQLINDLLEIARSESGTIAIAVSPHPFPPILERVTQGVASLLQEKNLTLQVEVAPLPAILCDETKLREVLLNLVSNAIKYNREGGVITIKAYLNEAQSKLVCQVSDTGFGIPKDQQDRIFQKFFRASTPGTQGVIGTGLGLFLTRMLVEKMGGKISFSSIEQQGTTFTFTLPVAVNN